MEITTTRTVKTMEFVMEGQGGGGRSMEIIREGGGSGDQFSDDGGFPTSLVSS